MFWEVFLLHWPSFILLLLGIAMAFYCTMSGREPVWCFWLDTLHTLSWISTKNLYCGIYYGSNIQGRSKAHSLTSWTSWSTYANELHSSLMCHWMLIVVHHLLFIIRDRKGIECSSLLILFVLWDWASPWEYWNDTLFETYFRVTLQLVTSKDTSDSQNPKTHHAHS
jgi:hypothetical protein